MESDEKIPTTLELPVTEKPQPSPKDAYAQQEAEAYDQSEHELLANEPND